MLTVSLHGISIQASRGLYPEEKLLYNNFEVDVDIAIPAGDVNNLPFVDYRLIRQSVADAFEHPYEILEHYVRDIHCELKSKFPDPSHVKVVIRKMNPPMPGEVAYARVAFEG